MNVALSRREIEFILEWKGRAFFPDDKRILAKLRRALEQEPFSGAALSRLQIQIVHGWLEEQSASHRGGASVRILEEALILGKLQEALE